MMEYKHLLPLLAVVITFLTISLPITSASARRRPTPTVPPVADDYEGSGDNVDMYGPHVYDDASGDDVVEGSADHGGHLTRNSPTLSQSPDFGFGAQTTTSTYPEFEVGGHEKEANVKVEALKVLITHPAVLAAIIIGGVLTILFIVLLVMFIIYRMRKKDEGSYILDDPKVAMIDHPQQQQTTALIYTKGPSNDQEFFA